MSTNNRVRPWFSRPGAWVLAASAMILLAVIFTVQPYPGQAQPGRATGGVRVTGTLKLLVSGPASVAAVRPTAIALADRKVVLRVPGGGAVASATTLLNGRFDL